VPNESDGCFSSSANLSLVDAVLDTVVDGTPEQNAWDATSEQHASEQEELVGNGGSPASASQAALRLAANAVATSSSVAAAEVTRSGLPAGVTAPRLSDRGEGASAENVWWSPPRGRQSLCRFRDWEKHRKQEKERSREQHQHQHQPRQRPANTAQPTHVPRLAAAFTMLVTPGDDVAANRLSPAFAESLEINKSLLSCENIAALSHVALGKLDAMVSCDLGTVNMATCIHRAALFWRDLQTEAAALSAQQDGRDLASLIQEQRTRVRI
jgi:hypothetical protein